MSDRPYPGVSPLQRLRRGETRAFRRATDHDLNGFVSERSKCHENVDSWCRVHPGHKPVRGWLVSGPVLDRHSVVDTGEAELLDITPVPDDAWREFLPHDATDGEFDALPSQLIAHAV